ncbi:lytic transglycosylase [Parendozoicomonas haliclonae]|uniref:Membrane-bound lytic murein transglycosylase D n=1 Tax=Parendozoicomonas haliclonae TaxID=1960125 RepID=A0A1X7AMD4_9GAMM|nr:LysM peptidoglycan-binding domain-containing protein [Parendozoicomonas haliclonae]SMA49137.1 Membrane-bound lytic murein transglycosylase D precursor [Parendozoicomonas haliclonae]
MQEKTPAQDACTKGLTTQTSTSGQPSSPYKLVKPLALVIALSGCQAMTPQSDIADNQPTLTPEAEQQLTEQTVVVAEQQEEVQPDLPPDDLVVVIRDGLALDLDADNARIRAQLRWYSRNQAYFDRVLDRASPYLHYIVSETQRRGMPMEFALLPVVESAFDPFAYSFARAAGLWQFIPSTGRHYGLEQNWWYDGRRDVVAATDAALTFLQELHGQFNDWELALAAYNSGRGTVSNAIRRNKKAGKPTDFWALSLPRETSAYVPKMLAVGKIFRDPAKYNLTLKEIPNEPHFEKVDIGQQIDLARAASLAGMELDELYRLNPGFNRWATSPDGPHHLLIPVALADEFKTSLAELPMEQRLKWQRYDIRSGDSLIKIAKRFSTTVDLIQDINQIDGSRIVAGKTLLIPVPSAGSEDYTLTAEQRQLAKASRPRSGRSKVNYVVRSGDSFWDIARDHKVSVKSLAAWNSMAPKDTLRVGQKLVIWTEAKTQGRNGVVRKVNYRVRNGDNLSVIANRYGISVSDIRSWNTLNAKYLQPGDTLTLFVDVTRSR